MNQYQIFGLGAALVDTEIEVNDQDLQAIKVEKGMMTLVDSVRLQELLSALEQRGTVAKRASGGSGCNSIIAASYFGAKTYYCCRVANDENGQFFANDLARAGVDSNAGHNAPEGTTGRCLALITPDAERSMNTCLAISETLSEAELDEQAAASADWVYIEGYQVTSASGRRAAVRLNQVARAAGNKISLSLSDPAMTHFFRDGLLEMIGEGVDLIFCNEQEAMEFTCTKNIEDAGHALLKFTKGYVITCGSKGAVAYDGEQLHHFTAKKVKAIDSNGAGDMFAGAFLAELVKSNDFKAAGTLAIRAAAKVVTQYGPRLAPEQHKDLL